MSSRTDQGSPDDGRIWPNWEEIKECVRETHRALTDPDWKPKDEG